ncbi:hypothetical protein CDH55_09275 [Escherichia coli]|nr:hypothetical protein CDH55_09275 [Escherichia coli]
MAVMNIFADLVYFILKANRIKKHFTYYLGVRKLLKSFFLFLFCSIMSMEGVVVSLYPFNIF